MKTTYHSIITFLFIVFAISAFAQKADYLKLSYQDLEEHPYWIEMMQDHSVNFYDVQKAFNIYFKDRKTGKGSGWKQFKRWEYYMESRVYPGGNRINSSMAWEEINAFNKLNPINKNREENTWTPLGPTTSQNITGHWNPGLGRLNVIARDPFDSNILYVGAPSGGLWKTVNEGLNWEVLTDHLPVMGVSAIAIDYTDTDIIYIGTGDKDANDTYSIGVLKSMNGGTTWDETGLDWDIGYERTISKLLIHPDDPEILFAAASDGLYKSTDGGDSWYMVQSGDIDDIEFKPDDPDVVYAVTKTFYRSTDGGESFSAITGLPGQYRVQIAVTEANSDYVYFFSSRDGIYRSEDSGLTFSKRSNQPNNGIQDWYDLAFAVSHVNAEEVHLGEINTYKSTDGGQSWGQTTDWIWPNNIGYTHCDIHELVFFGNTLYVGSDGLISKTTDGGSNWTNLSEGLSIRQFYRIGGTRSNPNKLMGGSQDNGTSVYTEDEWHEWLGADGMECLVDYTDDSIVYGTTQGGNFRKSISGGYFGGVGISQPGGGAWVTPFVIHPTEHETIFVGNSEVRKTTDGMQSWTTLSSFGMGTLNALSVGNDNPDYLYASKGSTIFRTGDGGQSWDNISSGLPDLYITYITVNPNDAQKVAVSLSGFQDGYKVFVSNDGGDNWENYSANLPNLPANCVVFNDDPFAGLYVGMDVGVYYRDETLDEWESFMNGLPNVIVMEFEINYDSGLIRAGTYGRGLWESELHPSIPLDIVLSYRVKSGGDDVIEYGETTSLDVTLKNTMPETAEDVSLAITKDNPYITLVDSIAYFGDIPAGDSVIIEDALSFDVATFIPDDYQFNLYTTITYDSVLEGKIKLKGYAPIVAPGHTTVDDGDNGQIDPGDEGVINLPIENTGGASASNISVNITTDDQYTIIANASASFTELISGQSEEMSFDFDVADDAPIGHVIIMAVNITADNEYVNEDTIAFSVGLIVEDFETGDFSKFPWTHEGQTDWTIDDETFYEGLYGARSGVINDLQETVLTLEIDVLGSGEISFYKKVSCEDDPNGTGYDYLSFAIDDQEQGRWDGEIDWSKETFEVSAGLHTFRWRFYKDPYVSEGQDAAWVDYITLPPVDLPVSMEEMTNLEKERVMVFPNPARYETTISFQIEQKTAISLEIFNSTGTKVKTLLNKEVFNKGQHSILWTRDDNTGISVPNGIYFYKLTAGEQYAGRIIVMH